ncbi:MAG TPA: FG-GAP-like repeat-containing protein [Candidatus Acidoferrales bacterium]|nr:FG-GAP-like repeat-containing protein [Candidatus Acidoferrales bacterium]
MKQAKPLAQASANQAPPKNQTEQPNPKKAVEAYGRGLKAEKAKNWAAAFAAYTEAAKDDASSREYAMRREIARSQLVNEAVERAERDALMGQDEQARKELNGALALDPSDQIVRERLAQLAPAATAALHQMLVQPAGAVRLEPLTGTRDLRFDGDTMGAYEEVARQFGVEASFDVDLVRRPVRLDLESVDFMTAMQALGDMTGTFWRPLTQRLFFVTSDTPEKRRQYDVSVVRTAQLPSSVTPADMTEMLRVVRTIAGINRADLNQATREITLRATPQAVSVASRLLDQLEQPQGEMVLEMEVLEVDRTAARQLGITPPESATTFSLTPQELQTAEQSAQGLISVIQQLFGSTSATSGLSASQIAALVSSGQLSLGSLIPPLVAFGGGKTTFLATLPGAAASFAEMLNVVRSGRRILLRAQNDKPVTFFVGERVPITLATFSANLGTSHFVPTVTSDLFPRVDTPTGIDPLAVAAADFNSNTDENEDLAVANHGDNTVTILLGKGDGTFSIGTPLTAGNQPVAIVSADFNGDGHQDLAVVNQKDNTVSIFLGNGDGTFTLKTTLSTGSNPEAIATADFSGDGIADLAVVNQGTTGAPGNSVSIFLGNGDGTFTTGSVLTTGRTPSAITAAAMVSGSNVVDFAVANQADNTVSVFLGKGDGTFTLKSTLATGNSPAAVVAAEFHSATSSNIDLAVANQADNTVSVFLGNGDGTFGTATNFATGTSPVALATADFNIDGQADLAVSDQTANTVSVFIGNGDGTFAPRLDLGTGTGPAGLVATILTSSGRPDLAIADSMANTVTVLLNNASFTSPGGGLPLNLFPNAEYQDVGLKIKATPHMNLNGEVTIEMNFELRSLTGDNVNGIPVISDQSVDQIVRVKDEETTALAGMLETQQMNTITGTPGLAGLGTLGRIASKHNKQEDTTELLILVTPRIVRFGPTTGKPIYAGRAPVGGSGAFTPRAVRP